MKNIFYYLIFLLSVTISYSQAGTNDNTFNTTDVGFGMGDGPNAKVLCSAKQTDGKILIGGSFTSYNGTNRNRIARLNLDGRLDTGFNPGTGAESHVHSIVLQPDGKILIGGEFTAFNGTIMSKIARLNTDGSLDTSFLGRANNAIYSVALQPDGKILIGGGFTSYNGTTRNYIARLNVDGSLDTSFNPGTGASFFVDSIALQPDGKILIGGAFTTYNGTTRKSIALLNADGSLDTSFNPGTGANSTINSVALQTDGKVLTGGSFTSYNGITQNRIARLNTDGSLDTGFNPGTGANNTISYVALQPDGKILIGGDFTTYNGTTRNRIARLNADGSLDTGFNPGTGANIIIFHVALQPDGKILIGGDFTTYNGTTQNYIARLNTDGSLDTNFNILTGANKNVYSIVLQPDGKILIGGDFTTYNGINRNRIARLNPDGSIDNGFNPGTGADWIVICLALQPDGKILIVGGFNSYNGTTRNRIARLNVDGSLDTSFNSGIGANSTIYSVAMQSDGKILIGGIFTSYNGTTRNRIARLNTDGSLDTSFNPSGGGANSTIYSIAIQPDGKILIGGAFTSYSNVTQGSIARLNTDGSLDSFTLNYLGSFNGDVNTITLQPDGKFLSGGDFTRFGSTYLGRIARLSDQGTVIDNSFAGYSGNAWVNNTIYSIALQPDGKILIGGAFTHYQSDNGNNPTTRNRIARLNANGSLDTDFNPGAGANNIIRTISVQPDGRILIGGDFTEYGGIGRNRIARINGGNSLASSEFEKKNITVYPNPTKNILHIDIEKEFKGLLVDITGKFLMEVSIKDIDISYLSPGIYFLKIISEGKHYSKKIIKE